MPAPRSALVVEDLPLVAASAEEMLREQGFEAIEVVKGCEGAIAALASSHFSFALVTIRLEDGACTPVIEALQAGGVPFVVVSELPDGRDLPPEVAGVPYIAKPYAARDLAAALRQLEN